MARVTRAALIQASNDESPDSSIDKIKSVMIDKHVELIKEAADKGAQVTCLQEIFYGPYFVFKDPLFWFLRIHFWIFQIIVCIT